MIRKRLALTLIETFTARERLRFGQFLHRADRAVRPDVLRLYEALPRFSDTVDREEVEQLVYGKEPVDRRRVNQLFSWLYAEATDFLLEDCRDEPPPYPLIAEFHRRGLPDHRDRLLRKLSRSPGNYREQYELARAVMQYGGPISRTQRTNFQELSDLADLDFAATKLKLACLMRSHENVYPADYDYGLLEALHLRLSPKLLAQHPVIDAYYQAYHFLTDAGQQTAFRRFQSLLNDQGDAFTDQESRDLYLMGINHCIRQSNRGDAGRAREALGLYRKGIDSGILLEDGRISPYTYRNAVALSLKIRDFDWAERFIHQAADLLPPDQRENLLHYNLASLAYHRGRLDDTLHQLRFVRSKDTLFTLTMDTLRAKVYYGNQDFALLGSHLEKMKIFLLRKDSSYHHRNYGNFIRYLRKLGRLAQATEQRRTAESRRLLDAIEEEEMLTERAWLRQQLSLLGEETA